jgi:hypothetical protein
MEYLIRIQTDGMQVEVLFYPVGRFLQPWEAVELSNTSVCPMYGPFEQYHNGPTAEFFETLNRIKYMSMPHSDGLYSLPDTPESSLSDLFGSTMSASISMASVVDSVVRARTDDGSVETEMESVHVGSDGTVTSMHVGPDGTINSTSQLFSSYTDCLPVLCKNPFWMGTGERSIEYASAASTSPGFSPAGTESLNAHGLAPCTAICLGLLCKGGIH